MLLSGRAQYDKKKKKKKKIDELYCYFVFTLLLFYDFLISVEAEKS